MKNTALADAASLVSHGVATGFFQQSGAGWHDSTPVGQQRAASPVDLQPLGVKPEGPSRVAVRERLVALDAEGVALPTPLRLVRGALLHVLRGRRPGEVTRRTGLAAA